jgi:gluconate 5-dehydrogenase
MTRTREPDIQTLFDLTGRVALITGAGGHLGRSMAAALAEAGSRVIVASRKMETARQVAGSLKGKEKGRHLPVVIDHMKPDSIERGFSQANKAAKGIDILVNNAHEPLTADWRAVTGEQFTQHLRNLTGYFLLARLLRDHAVARRSPASVIMLGSMYGQVASYPDTYKGISPANPVAYQALKGGVIQVTRHLAVYWAQDAVRVNCISPGPFPPATVSPKLVKRLTAKSPMRRIGNPHELKGAVVFLASDASSYVTGHNLAVDGGWTVW